MSETGIVIAGMSVLRQRLQEDEDDEHDEDDRFDERLQHFRDRLLDDVGGVEGDLVLHARRELTPPADPARRRPRARRRARWRSAAG